MDKPRHIGLLTPSARSHWIRLRTLIWLRWVAVFGQTIAITAAIWGFQIDLHVSGCFLVIGTAVVANLVAGFVYPENKRLTETEAGIMLLFDITQLAFLLLLSGGLHNPFALLIMTPVTISATALRQNATFLLGLTTILFASVLGVFASPLHLENGTVISQPDLLLFGFWVAIVIGVIFLGFYAGRVTSEINLMSDALLATQMALEREQKLTDLGGVVAAAAHEMGTPLATIKLVSSELIEELSEDAELREDAMLIGEQADRCRDILRSMGRAGKDDLHLRTVPISRLVEDAAEPHLNRGKTLHFSAEPAQGTDPRMPEVQRRAEIIHGIRNLVQNAVDFARANVWVETSWGNGQIRIRIMDDGDGFPPTVLGRIGDPFVRRRRTQEMQEKRPGYEGMGLGLFIAKTLLERTGARLDFANATDPYGSAKAPGAPRSGAVIEVIWPQDKIVVPSARERGALGLNQPFEG